MFATLNLTGGARRAQAARFGRSRVGVASGVSVCRGGSDATRVEGGAQAGARRAQYRGWWGGVGGGPAARGGVLVRRGWGDRVVFTILLAPASSGSTWFVWCSRAF